MTWHCNGRPRKLALQMAEAGDRLQRAPPHRYASIQSDNYALACPPTPTRALTYRTDGTLIRAPGASFPDTNAKRSNR